MAKTAVISMSGAQLIEGIDLALDQSKKLADDAIVLISAGSLSTANALAILSLEEAGKAVLIRNTLMRDKESHEKFREDFKSHGRKIRAAINFYLQYAYGQKAFNLPQLAKKPIPRASLIGESDLRVAAMSYLVYAREAVLYTTIDQESARFTPVDEGQRDVTEAALKISEVIRSYLDLLLYFDLDTDGLKRERIDRLIRYLKWSGLPIEDVERIEKMIQENTPDSIEDGGNAGAG